MYLSSIGYQPTMGYQAKIASKDVPVQQNCSFKGGAEKIVQKTVQRGMDKVVPLTIAGLAAMAAIVKTKHDSNVVDTIYGPIEHRQVRNADGEVTSSQLIVSRPNGQKIDIFEGIPLETLQSPVAEHIHQIKSSTINPEVGIVITQNQSKPVTARKITTEGTLEDSLVQNNSNNIPLKYDMNTGTQYADTPWNPGRQDITGNCLQVTYGTVREDWGARPEYIAEYANPETGEAPDVGTLAAQKGTEDRSFMPADIAGKQYEIITETGERIPCDYEKMEPGVDYQISKKAGVELKMAVPPTEVISSEGELLPADKLYMVDSDGHFYNGNPIKRIKSGEVNWNADMNDPVQAQIRNDIDKSVRLEAEAKTAKKEANNLRAQAQEILSLANQDEVKDSLKAFELKVKAEELNAKADELQNKANVMTAQAKQVTAKAEQEMTAWVRTAQNKNGVSFFQE